MPEVTCPNCGAKNSAGRNFCGVCGESLTAPVKVETSVQPATVKAVKPVSAAGVEIGVKPTWGLAWGLFWRIFLLMLLFGGIIYLIIYLLMLSNIIPAMQGSS